MARAHFDRVTRAAGRWVQLEGGLVMSLIRWEPFKGFDEFFERAAPSVVGRWPRLFDEEGSKFEWAPAADISETDKEYLVKAELPGVKREDVKITLDDGVITIAGERKQEKEEKDEKRHRVERLRHVLASFGLPENVEAKSIRAESKDGVLYVHIPKTRVEKAKSVQIKVE
jgi:HSP20 family protein